MFTKRYGNGPAKLDLHVGGLGATGSGTFASSVAPLANPSVELSDAWIGKVRDVVHSADQYVRHNPWAAVGMAAWAAISAAYVLSRRN